MVPKYPIIKAALNLWKDYRDGCIFCVDGMTQLTPAGEKFKDIVTERRWTQFG